MVTTAYHEVRDQLQDLLAQAGLSKQALLIAAHLAEIEEEIDNFLDQLVVFRTLARQHEFEAAQEALVEISLSLQHIADHAQTVTPILDRELGIGDEN